jgi:glycosyltransferase involved in cell wall biosynthesis
MHSGRILYLNHDNPVPSGGVRVIYDHVQHLVRNGYDAFVVHHSAGFRPTWFQDDIPLLHCNHQFMPRPDDLVIIPEDHAGYLELFRSIPVCKVVFCQNHFYIFQGIRSQGSWASFGISAVMACSDPVADFVCTFIDVKNVRTVHNAVSPQFAACSSKKFQIAYMPRKRSLEADFIKNLCIWMLELSCNIEWVALDGLHQDEVVKALGESAIFLSLSRLEGLGLPPLEAMASGCVVVGFTGFGGREYARPDNGFWCDEDDLIGCARLLANVVRMFMNGAPEVANVIANASRTASEYSCQRQEQELLIAIEHFLDVEAIRI